MAKLISSRQSHLSLILRELSLMMRDSDERGSAGNAMGQITLQHHPPKTRTRIGQELGGRYSSSVGRR